MDYRQNADRDELRARFTAWLDTLIRRAKLNYLRKTEIPVDIVSLEELFEENIPVSEDEWMRQLLFQDNDFNFEEERLATAYAELPLMRQQILKLLYVDACLIFIEKSPSVCRNRRGSVCHNKSTVCHNGI